jgi:Flp pilus assembly protein TadG
MKNYVWARIRGDAGQALVESALVLPILLFLLFGIAKFGITFNNHIMLTDAARSGARLMSISRAQTTEPCSLTRTRIQNASMLPSGSLTITLTINGTVYTGGTCPGVALVSGTDVVALVTTPCNLVVMGVNFAPNCMLTARSTERVE